MAIAYQSSGTKKALDATTSVGVPSGVIAGDLILLVVVATSTGGVISFSWPSGFSQKVFAGPNTMRLGAAWKRAAGSESGSYTMSAPGSVNFSAQAHRFSGVVVSGDPFRQVPVTATGNSNEVAVTIPSIPLGDLICHIVATNSSAVLNSPAGYAARGSNANALLSTKPQTVTGSTGSVNGGNSTLFSTYDSALFSLIPATSDLREWNGTQEVPLSLYEWNGTQEVPLSLYEWNGTQEVLLS